MQLLRLWILNSSFVCEVQIFTKFVCVYSNCENFTFCPTHLQILAQLYYFDYNYYENYVTCVNV